MHRVKETTAAPSNTKMAASGTSFNQSGAGSGAPATGTYSKMKGFATTEGQMYEVKTSALLYMKGLNSGRPFQLASNVAGAGAYDDIIFRLLNLGDDWDNGSHWTTYLFQLKHKLKDEITPVALTVGKDFGLVKYHKSFLETRDTMLAGDKGDIFNGNFKNCHFVIFTNAPASEKLKNLYGITDESANVDNVVRFGGSEYIFGLGGCQDIASCLEGKYLGEDFLKQLKMFSEEPRVENMSDLISNEILKIPSFPISDHIHIKRISEIFVNEFQAWCEISNEILDENSEILNRAISKHKIEVLIPLEYKRLTLDLTFKDPSVQNIRKALEKQYSLLHVITSEHFIEVSCTKLLQALKHLTKCPILTSLECFLENKDAFLTNWGTLLVIVDDKSTSNSDDLNVMDGLWPVLEEDTNKRLVFLSSSDNKFVALLKKHPGARLETVRDSFDLGQLTPESLEKNLKTKTLFQGREIEKRNLVGDWQNGFQERTPLISNFVVKDVTEPIGQTLSDESIDFHIPRTLHRRNYIKKSIFKSHSLNGKIAISGITDSELQRLVPCDKKLSEINIGQRVGVESSRESKFIVLDPKNEDRHFKQLCESYANVHWLLMKGDQLAWQRSHGSVGEILEHIDEDQTSEYKPTTILDLEDRIVLLVAEPGMGKSTLASHLAQQTKQRYPFVWVVFVNLFDHLEKLESECTGFKASEFFCSLGAGSMSPLIKALFEHNVSNNGNTVVILDGYDELPETCLENCNKLLQYLITSNVKKLLVTSRTFRGQTLENHLSTIAFSLKMYTPGDQKVFLKKYWSDVETTLSESQQEDFISKILKLVRISIGDKERQFTGIPLQLKMVADIFKENYANKIKKEIPKNLDVLYLYELFINEKHRIFFEKIGFSIDRCKPLFKKHCQGSDKEHMAAAMLVLLDGNSLENLHDKNIRTVCDSFMANVMSGEEKTGIVVRVVNGIPLFIHKTFIEFYGGIWMYDYYQQNETFLRTHFYREEFQVTRNIFDRKLSRDLPLHTAVLNGNASQVEALLESGNVVNLGDLGGRTALHLAAAVGFRDSSVSKVNLSIVAALLEYGADVEACDTGVLKWTPLRYADETRAYDVINLLLKTEKTDHNDMKLTKNIVENPLQLNVIIHHGFLQVMHFLLHHGLNPNAKLHDKMSLLHKAAECRDDKLSKLLIEYGAAIMPLDQNNNTPLHVAALSGCLPVAQILLENISDDTITITQYMNARNADQDTALHCAARGGHVDIMRLLVSLGGDLKERGFMDSTPLHRAAFNGHLSVVQFLLENISDDPYAITQYVNARDTDQDTAMHWAAQGGNVDVMRLLFSVGGDLESRDFKDSNLMHRAAFYGHLSVAQFLLENISHDTDAIKQYVNARDTAKDTVLHYAAQGGNVDIMRLLVGVGGDLEAHGLMGSTLMHKAALSGQLPVAQFLLENISNDPDAITQFLNARDSVQDTVIHLAAKGGHVHIMRLFVSVGGDLEARGFLGGTLMHKAAFHGQLPVAQFLLKNISRDPDAITQYVNALDILQDTAMHSAATAGHIDIMRLLVSVGGDLEARGFKDGTLMHKAAFYGRLSVAHFLLENISDDPDAIAQYVNARDNVQDTAMHCAAKKGHFDIMCLLVSVGGDLETRGYQGLTLLHHAAINGHLSVAQFLLKNISDEKDAITQYVNVRDTDAWTAMHHAAQKGHADILKLLCRAGGDIMACTSHSSTTLNIAAEYGHVLVVNLIIDTLRDSAKLIDFLNIRDNDGDSALLCAAHNGHLEIVKTLANNGADVSLPNEEGKTSLHVAALNGHLSVVEVLINSFVGNSEARAAFLDARDLLGESGLTCAKLSGHSDIAALLVAASCQVS